jgi:hypothetical protein
MTLHHAVVWTDHRSARVLQFDADQVVSQAVHMHSHPTAQHGSGVRTQHEFFGQLCDALDAVESVLVTGSHSVLADLRHYVEKHRSHTAGHIVGYEVVDHPSDNQLVAQGRAYFAERIRLGELRAP